MASKATDQKKRVSAKGLELPGLRGQYCGQGVRALWVVMLEPRMALGTQDFLKKDRLS